MIEAELLCPHPVAPRGGGHMAASCILSAPHSAVSAACAARGTACTSAAAPVSPLTLMMLAYTRPAALLWGLYREQSCAASRELEPHVDCCFKSPPSSHSQIFLNSLRSPGVGTRDRPSSSHGCIERVQIALSCARGRTAAAVPGSAIALR
eukprot:1070768-Prymnesium_polylepis.1